MIGVEVPGVLDEVNFFDVEKEKKHMRLAGRKGEGRRKFCLIITLQPHLLRPNTGQSPTGY